MLTTAPHLYVESDLGVDQTLTEWRRVHDAERGVSRRRRHHLPRLLPRLVH